MIHLKSETYKCLINTKQNHAKEQIAEMDDNLKKNNTILFYRAFKNKINGYQELSFNLFGSKQRKLYFSCQIC